MINQFPPSRHARLDINLSNLIANYKHIQNLAQGKETAAVVKANAYGLGVDGVVPALIEAGCKTFFVATPAEGAKLRSLSDNITIYTFNGADTPNFMATNRLRPVINTLEALKHWQKTGLAYALHIDTGMNRLGLRLEDLNMAEPDENCTLLISHLVAAESESHPKNAAQLAQFQEVRERFPNVPASLANSGGVALDPDFHFDMVRAGIVLYGGFAGERHTDIKPVVSLSAPIQSVRRVNPGESVGYGADFVATKPMDVATLGIGYADGLFRAYRGSVSIKGQKCPIIGRISMDLTTIDVTDLSVSVGEETEIFGRTIPLAEVAKACGTIDYEVLTRISDRVERAYSTS